MDRKSVKKLNKIFECNNIKTVWDRDSKKYYVNVIDIINLFLDRSDSIICWEKIKSNFKNEYQVIKLKNSDYRYSYIDICDVNTIFKIIDLIP